MSDSRRESPVGFHLEAASIGLTPAESFCFFGMHRDYPVAFTVRASEAGLDPMTHSDLPKSLGLLLQIRHATPQDRLPSNGKLHGSADLDVLVEQGQARLTIDERTVWLAVYDALEIIHNMEIVTTLDDLIEAMAASGLMPPSKNCEWCHRASVERPTLIDGSVLQVCQSCINERDASLREQSRATPQAVMLLGLICPAISILGAAIWAGIWFGIALFSDWMRESFGTKVLILPTIIKLIFVSMAAFSVAAPIAYIIRRIPGRGVHFAGSCGLASCIVAIVLGELVLLCLISFRGEMALGLVEAIQSLPEFWIAGGVHSLVKLGIASLACYFSYYYSRTSLSAVRKGNVQ